MYFASEFRRMAREALQGKWVRTVLIILLAGLMGAVTGVPATPSLNIDFSNFSPENLESIGSMPAQIQSYISAYQDLGLLPVQTEALEEFLLPLVISFMLVGFILLLIALFLGSIARIGLFAMGDRMLDGEKPRPGMLFPKGIYWKSIGLNIQRSVRIFLWSLLFVIPGIIAAYRYSMADYVLYKNPELRASEAIEASKSRMQGHKAQLFMLELSFIGWSLLCSVPLYVAAFVGSGFGPAIFCSLISSIGMMFVNAYMHISMCAFFRHMDHPWNRYRQEQAQGFSWEGYAQNGESDADSNTAETASAEARPVARPVTVDTEPLARALFHRYGCSRQRIEEAGEMEIYASYRIDSSVEHRWIREHGQALMLRFGHDPAALDDLLPLIGEYALDELLDRTLARIERHVRQQTLPDAELMNMLGRSLAMICSGVFADREAYVLRKKEQISALADILVLRLEERGEDGDWRQALLLIRQMCA